MMSMTAKVCQSGVAGLITALACDVMLGITDGPRPAYNLAIAEQYIAEGRS